MFNNETMIKLFVLVKIGYLLPGHLAVIGSAVTNGSDWPCKFSAMTRNSYCLPSSRPLTAHLFSKQCGATLVHLKIKLIFILL